MQKTQQSFDLNSNACLELSLPENEEKKCQGLKTPERALLLINASPADSLKVITDLKKIEGISEVYPLKGMYDIIAFVEAESFEKLKETVFNQIKRITNVRTTLTLTFVEGSGFGGVAKYNGAP